MPRPRQLNRVRRRVLLLGLVLLLGCGGLASTSPVARNIAASLLPTAPVVYSAGLAGISVSPKPSSHFQWENYIPPVVGLPYLCDQRSYHSIPVHPLGFEIFFWYCSF